MASTSGDIVAESSFKLISSVFLGFSCGNELIWKLTVSRKQSPWTSQNKIKIVWESVDGDLSHRATNCNSISPTKIIGFYLAEPQLPDHGKYHFFQKKVEISRISSGRYPESLGPEFICASTLDRPS